jgi:hydroxyethylthiazole kinase-like uncharacterized protein yjeF
MLKVLTSPQIREVDQSTIENEPIESIDLMERAARKYSDWILKNTSSDNSVAIIAGMGNNGGDALAIARHLIDAECKVEVIIVKFSPNYSNECNLNRQRLLTSGVDIQEIENASNFSPNHDIIIDGIFGSGLSRPLEGFVAQIVAKINAANARVLAIDIPSGIFADYLPKKLQVHVNAEVTLTFQAPKLSSLIPFSGEAFGMVQVLDIGLNEKAIEDQVANTYYVDAIQQFAKYFKREKFNHKGSHGHVLVAAGSKGKMGAAILSIKSALRSGAGLCTGLIPQIGLVPLQVSIPEAMAITRDADHLNEKIGSLRINSVAIGPGLGADSEALILFEWVLQHLDVQMLVDADALNLMAANRKLLTLFPKGSILTPHIKEFERLFGTSVDEIDRIELLRTKAIELGHYLVLKGPHTAIATPDGKVYFNSTGNPGMATAGSGDCLTGIIAGLFAQSKNAFVSAVCGVCLHGVAGDIAASKLGYHAMIATDIIENIGDAFKVSINFDV